MVVFLRLSVASRSYHRLSNGQWVTGKGDVENAGEEYRSRFAATASQDFAANHRAPATRRLFPVESALNAWHMLRLFLHPGGSIVQL